MELSSRYIRASLQTDFHAFTRNLKLRECAERAHEREEIHEGVQDMAHVMMFNEGDESLLRFYFSNRAVKMLDLFSPFNSQLDN